MTDDRPDPDPAARELDAVHAQAMPDPSGGNDDAVAPRDPPERGAPPSIDEGAPESTDDGSGTSETD